MVTAILWVPWTSTHLVLIATAAPKAATPIQNTLFLQVGVPVITLVLGAILGAWSTVFLTRPKLRATGGGGGGGGPTRPGYGTTHARITNTPGVMGISLQETVLFGKRIHGRIDRALTVTRNPANECIAHARDLETGEIIPLWWRKLDVPGQVTRVITLKSGESADLILFARRNDEPLRYFIYQSANGEFGQVSEPVDDIKYRENKRFLIRIDYSYGHQKLEFEASATRGYNGMMTFRAGASGTSF